MTVWKYPEWYSIPIFTNQSWLISAVATPLKMFPFSILIKYWPFYTWRIKSKICCLTFFVWYLNNWTVIPALLQPCSYEMQENTSEIGYNNGGILFSFNCGYIVFITGLQY